MSFRSQLKDMRFELARSGTGDTRYNIDTYRTLAGMREWKPNDIIVDVGANDGRTILRWRRHLRPTRIFAFEPVKNTFEKLAEQTGSLPGVRLFQCALGSSPERRTIYLHGDSALNSFYPEHTNAAGSEEVEVDTLDAVLDREGIDRVQLLKIDAEGHDLEVLNGATAALRSGSFEMIQVEAGFDAPGPPKAALWDFHALLSPFGYHLYAITNQCRSRMPQAVSDSGSTAKGRPSRILNYCDAIFICSRQRQFS